MLISVNKISDILVKYVDTVLKPKVQGRGDILSFGVGVARYALPIMATAQVTKHTAVLKELGIISESDMLDIDKAVEVAKSGLSVSGKLDIFGYSFDNADVDALANIAKGEVNVG